MSASIASSGVPQSPGATDRWNLRRIRPFAADRNGSVAITFALALVAMCMFVGAAVDLGRLAQARHQSSTALDAAVIAGARVLQDSAKTVEEARLAAHKFYTENTKDRIEVVDDSVSFDAVDENMAFAGTHTAYIKPAFLSFAGISKLPVNTYAKAVMAGDPVEIALMLDVTGSMGMPMSKIVDLKAAATDLVNIVLPDGGTAAPVHISVVPFAEGVRLPSNANTKARGTPAKSVKVNYKQGWTTTQLTYELTECVVERKGANRYTDAAPGPGDYVMSLYNRTIAIYVSGKCGMSAKDTLQPLTSNKATLLSKIDDLELSGGTAGQVGTAWAWYTLSPNWNSLWPAANQASAYNSGTRKVAILMTDGEYNVAYDTNGIQFDMPGAGSPVNGDSPTQARSVCTAMKAKGITIYTVGFALGGNATAINTLNHCASDPSMAYTAESGNQLKQAFRDIAFKINQLYLTN